MERHKAVSPPYPGSHIHSGKAKNVPCATGQERGFMLMLIRSTGTYFPLKIPLASKTLGVTFAGKQDKNCALLLLGCSVNIPPPRNTKPT